MGGSGGLQPIAEKSISGEACGEDDQGAGEHAIYIVSSEGVWYGIVVWCCGMVLWYGVVVWCVGMVCRYGVSVQYAWRVLYTAANAIQ